MPQPGGTHTYVHGDARPSTQRAAGAGAAGARHTDECWGRQTCVEIFYLFVSRIDTLQL